MFSELSKIYKGLNNNTFDFVKGTVSCENLHLSPCQNIESEEN